MRSALLSKVTCCPSGKQSERRSASTRTHVTPGLSLAVDTPLLTVAGWMLPPRRVTACAQHPQRIGSLTRHTMMQQLPVQVHENASMCATFDGSSIMPGAGRSDET